MLGDGTQGEYGFILSMSLLSAIMVLSFIFFVHSVLLGFDGSEIIDNLLLVLNTVLGFTAKIEWIPVGKMTGGILGSILLMGSAFGLVYYVITAPTHF